MKEQSNVLTINKVSVQEGSPLCLYNKEKVFFVQKEADGFILVERSKGWKRDSSVPKTYVSRLSDTYWWVRECDLSFKIN